MRKRSGRLQVEKVEKAIEVVCRGSGSSPVKRRHPSACDDLEGDDGCTFEYILRIDGSAYSRINPAHIIVPQSFHGGDDYIVLLPQFAESF